MTKYEITFEDGLMELMESFVMLTQRDMDDLQVAIDCDDLPRIEAISHTLKGDSGGYGFNKMSEISREIEAAAKASDLVKAGQYFLELSNYWEQLRVAYKAVG